MKDVRTPGQLIATLLAQRNWTNRVLAIVLSVDEAVVTRMVADKRAIDAPMAIQLQEVFGVPAERFLSLQKDLELAIARFRATPDPRRHMRASLFSMLPVSEMIKRGWLKVADIRDVDAVERELTKFFGADSIHDIEILPHASKKTSVRDEVTPAQLAWLYRVKHCAMEVLVPRYSPAAVEKAIKAIGNLVSAAEEMRKVPRILAEAGIRFVIVESLSAAKIDGVCFWLNDFSPVIGMTLRHDRVDNFVFVLRHELEHVARRHGRDVVAVDSELEGARAGTGPGITDEERIANEAAAEFCVPQKQLARFIKVRGPFYSERDIIGFARTIKVHPGIVAGQLQHQTGRYDLFRNHLVKIRSIVSHGAMIDGWGDVAPVGVQ